MLQFGKEAESGRRQDGGKAESGVASSEKPNASRVQASGTVRWADEYSWRDQADAKTVDATLIFLGTKNPDAGRKRLGQQP